ncbi:ATP-binding protein [Alkalihalobacillus sp. MEB130]|uniref:ATP-binding protein n=1 Tax=Alkalihalobacillus sp. MEB130 TaxID=2976704 RepID=UPI0028DEE04A|nr:ATP-binding protein [Alkalihalobacillus sp. MEB130]MDT8860911.1 ATP-binding protein [Alkalihalobacillus sp. MEB130]
MIAEKLLLHVLIVLMPILVVTLLLNDRKEKQAHSILVVLLGAAAVLCIVFAFEEDGLYWDLRYVLLMIAFLYGGKKAGWALCGVILVTRTFIGGEQLLVGYVITLTSSFIFSLAVHRYNQLVHKWKRVRFAMNLIFWPALAQLTLLTIYLEMKGDLYRQHGHFIFYTIVFTVTLLIAVGFATLLLEQLLERKRIQIEMQRAVKLNAISELAASIAHEVRNPLTVVKGFLQLMQKDEQGKKKNYFEIALCEMNRAEQIISDYLNFAKPQFKNIENMEVNQILKEILSFLTPYSLKENVALSIQSSSNKIYIKSDKNQFKQVLINIIKNAVEATPEKGNVLVTVEEDQTVVKITITDNGKGMSADQLANIGTLFYSTKEKGTGLGTMVSFRIIEEMGGTLRYESSINIGTKVTIILPVDPISSFNLEAASAISSDRYK